MTSPNGLQEPDGSTYGSFVNGEDVRQGDVGTPLVDPSTGREWAKALSSEGLADQAVSAAATAFAAAGWSDGDPARRAQVMWDLAGLIERNAEELARLEVLASGKTMRTTRREIARSAAWWRYFSGSAERLDGRYIPLGESSEARIRYDPLGVVLAITPYNGTISLGSWKMAPALAAGNAVVLKPPIEAPGASLLLARLAMQAGMPAGILNVVPGGAEIGTRLVADPRIDMVSFTGSTAVACRIGAQAASFMKRFVCEAGGKSAQIIFADADLDAALVQARQGVFSNTGQSCVAGSRLLVERPVYERFLERLVENTNALRVGDPFADTSHIGPIASSKQYQRVVGLVDRARGEGAQVLAGGKACELGAPFEDGFFYRPTVLANAGPDSEIWHNEVFGPVTLVHPFDGETEAVALSNATQFGLAASVWTNDVRRAHRVSSRLDAGTVWVNTYRAMHYRIPFGGVKQSGIGRENGRDAVLEFVKVRSIVTDHAPPADAFAF